MKLSGFIFFITYGLFYNKVSTYDYIVLNDALERLWKKWSSPTREQSRHFSERTAVNHTSRYITSILAKISTRNLPTQITAFTNRVKWLGTVKGLKTKHVCLQ